MNDFAEFPNRKFYGDGTLGTMRKDELLKYIKDIEESYKDLLAFYKDAVPVIRCKDCARNPRNNGGKRILCPCPMDRYMGDEGYCSKAERRGEE